MIRPSWSLTGHRALPRKNQFPRASPGNSPEKKFSEDGRENDDFAGRGKIIPRIPILSGIFFHERPGTLASGGSNAQRPTPNFQSRTLPGCARPCRDRCDVYAGGAMSTVTEIKQAVSKLPPRKKLALVRWMQAQVTDRFSDEEMMAIAAEGARALDKREAAHAKRRTR